MKYFFVLFAIFTICACTKSPSLAPKNTLNVLTDASPRSINPRQNFDRQSDQIQQLVFLTLTQMNENSRVIPLLANKWSADPSHKKWTFYFDAKIPFFSESSSEISVTNIYKCFENFRDPKNQSLVQKTLLPEWSHTTLQKKNHSITFIFSNPQLYVPEILTSFFYFQAEHQKEPCTQPDDNDRLFAFGKYAEADGFISLNYPKEKLLLLPKEKNKAALQIHFIRDENTRLLSFLKGEGDIVLNGFNLTNTHYLLQQKEMISKKNMGQSMDYLGFNLKDPILKNPSVRKAIAHAIDRDSIIQYKYKTLVEKTDQILPITLFPKLNKEVIDYSPEKTRELLKGQSLNLNFLTTTQPIGIERALILRDQLKKSNIHLKITVVEPAIFFKLLQEGHFQLFSTRLVKLNNPSFYKKVFSSHSPQNYFSYENPELDLILKKDHLNLSDLKNIEAILQQDLPVFPLWFWSNVLVYHSKKVDAKNFKNMYMNASLLTLESLKSIE